MLGRPVGIEGCDVGCDVGCVDGSELGCIVGWPVVGTLLGM